MFELIRANQRRTIVLVVAMAALLAFGGYAIAELVEPGAGPAGVALGVALWVVLALVAYYSGDNILLGLAGARQIQKKHHPVLFNVVEEMSIAAGLPKPPAVYIVEQATPNAFAVGRESRVICPTFRRRLPRNTSDTTLWAPISGRSDCLRL